MELKTELKDFQKETFKWMKHHETKYDGGMLFSEPGLGKSLSMLAVICSNPLKTLIVVNSGLIDNWIDEIKKHTNISKLKIVKYHGSNRDKYVVNDKHLIYITSYSIVSREFNKGQFDKSSILSNIKFERIVLDEAHYIRNDSCVHRSIMYLSEQNISIKKWTITATPIFNDQNDMFAYFKFLNLEGIDSKKDWVKRITKSVDGLHILNDWIKKYSISYKKENVLKELKSKDEKIIKLSFNKLELNFYNSLKEYSSSRMKLLVKRIEKLNKNAFQDINGSIRKILHTNVMVYILRLRQACNSPLLVLKCMKRLKGINNMETAIENLKFYNESKNIEDECPICYDKIADYIAEPCGHKCCEGCWNKMFNANVVNCPQCRTYVDNIKCINENKNKDENVNEINLSELKETSKIKYIIELIKDVIEKDEKIVIVSQWVGMLDILRNIFNNENELKDIKYMSLQGNVSLENRSKYITEFQNKKDIKVCFISLMSSAEGINLTAANHLVLIDSWYNKSKMIQVSDRIHRIGQEKQVTIYNLQIENTIEQQVEKLVEKKSKITNLILNKWSIKNKEVYDDSWMNNIVKLISE
jgi:SNF2 family DNA or RNA helicase